MGAHEEDTTRLLELLRLEFDLLLTSFSAVKPTYPAENAANSNLQNVPRSSQARDLIPLVQEGRYLDALQNPINKELFDAPLTSQLNDIERPPSDSAALSQSAKKYYEDLSERISTLVSEASQESKRDTPVSDADLRDQSLRFLALGVSALYVFVQANLTG